MAASSKFITQFNIPSEYDFEKSSNPTDIRIAI